MVCVCGVLFKLSGEKYWVDIMMSFCLYLPSDRYPAAQSSSVGCTESLGLPATLLDLPVVPLSLASSFACTGKAASLWVGFGVHSIAMFHSPILYRERFDPVYLQQRNHIQRSPLPFAFPPQCLNRWHQSPIAMLFTKLLSSSMARSYFRLIDIYLNANVVVTCLTSVEILI